MYKKSKGNHVSTGPTTSSRHSTKEVKISKLFNIMLYMSLLIYINIMIMMRIRINTLKSQMGHGSRSYRS